MIFVDPLMYHGWVLRSRPTKSSHLMCDGDLEELHQLAESIGLKRAWFQPKSVPHYDVTPSKRALAVANGAVELDRRGIVVWIRLWRWWNAGCRR